MIEMLWGISFSSKAGMIGLGIDSHEWSPQRLAWEAHRVEHLAFTRNLEVTHEEWIGYPWFSGYAIISYMAGTDWTTSHLWSTSALLFRHCLHWEAC